ncbi:axonemal dynein light intermediate polypeptide 1-like isoform X2 [Homarus americanus]|uniref:axonemal dynein light intermediate polypeptide 1-like isoform X2 n=1 Tax=Homarus americanus TaxID=6706 RepID=UPI001C452CA1|nr:axonemal dynein light intermediate polypeptide 1-like isoform X2 [Homarus americanus]
MDVGLLQLEAPIKINSNGEQVEQIFDDSLEESEDDLEIITAALEMDSMDDDEDNEATITDKERGEKIIDVLIPPCEWQDEEGMTWIQRVSRAPPSRTAVILLWEQLDLKIKEQQARTGGICSIRRDLYRECFDELIRQVTLDCPERGLLLSRVRDEANMTIAAFQCLFQCASEFGATKAIQVVRRWEERRDVQQTLFLQVRNWSVWNDQRNNTRC